MYVYINREEWLILGITYVTSNAEEGDEGEKRESYLFHHTTRFHCASVAATLSQGPTGGYTCSHRFWSALCGPKLARFWTVLSG